MRRSALLFDFGGTLDADGLPWKERFLRLFAAEGIRVPGESFDRAFYSADDALVGRIPRESSIEDVVMRLARDVADALAAGAAGPNGDPGAVAIAVRAGAAPRVAARFLAETRHRLSENLPVLSDLSRRYRLGIVSNFYGNLEAVCRGTGIAGPFSVMIDSEVVGYRKPDARIFRAALDALEAAPSEAVFVGDSMRRDMAGARALGMPHVWLSPEAGAGPCCPGDRVISSLVDLPGVLA